MNAFDYLGTLPASTLDRIYDDPWACQAVFQSLTPLAKQFSLRMLCIDSSISQSIMHSWIQTTPTTHIIFEEAISMLLKLRVFLEDKSTGKSLVMNPPFQNRLKLALSTIGGSPWEQGRQELREDKKPPLPEELERYSIAKWDSVLHFMVGSSAVIDPPNSVIDLLLRTKLMQPTGKGTSVYITDSGYEFMLKDIHVQMWIFMLEYIKTLNNSGGPQRDDILKFLFQLSYCETYQYYAVADLTKTQKLLLNDFKDFGLLYQRKSSSSRFYTTRLAVNLIFGGSTNQSREPLSHTQFAGYRDGKQQNKKNPSGLQSLDPSNSNLAIVVETNFKIYAYTSSHLHVAMLSVFVDIVVRLPNLAVGFITRESLRSALIHGISADQIYSFLLKHAHPNMKFNNPIIPENITDQLYLWERERNRIQFIEGIFFDGFSSNEQFQQVLRYCKDLNVLTWCDTENLKLCISSKGEENVRNYINSITRR